ISDPKDQRLLSDYRTLSGQWVADAEQILALSAEGQRDEAVSRMRGGFAKLGDRLSTVSSEWIQHNEKLAADAGKAALGSIADSHRNMIVAVAVALALAGWLGLVTFRKIVKPICALEGSVKSIAAGDYSKEVPCTSAPDE